MDIVEINRRFKYHPPSDATRDLHQALREHAIAHAHFLDEMLPGDSREKSLAFTAFEESQFWAHAHLARNLDG